MTQQIGYLETVEPRQLFPNEAGDFTTWLEGHIEVLGDRLGLTLSNAEREQAVGMFSVDLRAEDGDGRLVVIENQLEQTDHEHLGKVLTYLVNLEAKTAIWVSPTPRPEHVRVIQWLNEVAPDDMAFYSVRLEVFRIGESLPAPLFTAIVAPSEEARRVGTERKELAQTPAPRREFWMQLLELSRSRTHLFRTISPSDDDWISFGGGKSGLQFSYVIGRKCSCVRLDIDAGPGSEAENKRIFDHFRAAMLAIERDFGDTLEWDHKEGRRVIQIKKWINGSGLSDREEWPAIQDQMIDAMIRLERALRPHIERLRLS